MKKIILILCMVLCLFGCNSKEKELVQNEINKAEQKVTQLETVNAQKWAPGQYQAAMDTLLEAEEQAEGRQFTSAQATLQTFHSRADQAINESIKERQLFEVEEARLIQEAQLQAEEAAKKAAEPKFYTVQRGDWLRKIARDKFDNKFSWQDLLKANQDEINEANMIYPNQKLKLPQTEVGQVTP